VSPPETRYAKTTDGVHIAYEVVGGGPSDLVFVPGFVSNVELSWDWPEMARFYQRLASFSRLIIFDRRGTGLSDHIIPREQQLTLEARMDDVHAVMDAAGSERATLFGFEESFAVCAMFAATYPERTAALIGHAPSGLGRADAGQPWAFSDEDWARYLVDVAKDWGTLALAVEWASWVWRPRARPRVGTAVRELHASLRQSRRRTRLPSRRFRNRCTSDPPERADADARHPAD